MKLVEVGSVLPNGLSAPDFPFLIPNADRYSVALLQPVGKIVAKSDGVRHADSELARAKFLSYLKLAADRKADIAVTPEYSCPWPVVREAVHSKFLPHEAGLWILGCEAITLGQLQAFK